MSGVPADGSDEAIENACVQLLTDLDMDRKNHTAVATNSAGAMKCSKNITVKLLSYRAEGLFSQATVFTRNQ